MSLNKSYVVYTEILTNGEPMDCVYLLTRYCTAQVARMAGKIPSAAGYYKPTDEERKSFCNNSNEFRACPRFVAFQMHLSAKGLTK